MGNIFCTRTGNPFSQVTEQTNTAFSGKRRTFQRLELGWDKDITNTQLKVLFAQTNTLLQMTSVEESTHQGCISSQEKHQLFLL